MHVDNFHATIHQGLHGNHYGLLLICQAYGKFKQLLQWISLLYCSVFSLIGKFAYVGKGILYNLSIILWRIAGAFHPLVYEDFPQGTSCVVDELLCVIELLIVKGPQHIIVKSFKVQASPLMLKTSTWYQSIGHEGAQFFPCKLNPT